MLLNLLKNILGLNYCKICKIDKSIEFGLCKFCISILPWFKSDQYRCHKCLKILLTTSHLLCDDCNYNNHQNFNKVYAIFNYQPPIKQMLLELKFKHKLHYAKLLSDILYQKIIKQWYFNDNLPEALIPVPLHINRLKHRGFNQTIELIRTLEKIIKIDRSSCTKIKNTISQMHLIKPNRTLNLKHAFIAKKMPYKHIAIIDDVITTGSTIKSLSKAIKQKNPLINIDLWCIARA